VSGSGLHIYEDAKDPEFDELAGAARQLAGYALGVDDALLLAQYLGVEKEHFRRALSLLRSHKLLRRGGRGQA